MLTEGVKWTDAVQAIVSVVGFIVIIIQLRQLKLSLQSDTHSKLYTHYLEMIKLFLEKPELRPYFYEGKAIQQSVPNHARTRQEQEVEVMCEIMLSVFEHAVMQEKNLPKDSRDNCWEAYVRERYNGSPELKRFFEANRTWYAKALSDLLHS
jgi:hypothetical protein